MRVIAAAVGSVGPEHAGRIRPAVGARDQPDFPSAASRALVLTRNESQLVFKNMSRPAETVHWIGGSVVIVILRQRGHRAMSSKSVSKEQRRRRALRAAAPAAGLLAAGLLVWQGSYSAFSATTANTGDVWTAGTLTLTNNGGGAAYAATTTATFNEVGLKPGSTNTKCITVKSVGTAAGALKFYESALADSAPSLGAQIQVTIDAAPVGADVLANCAGFPAVGLTNVATGIALTALPVSYAGAVPSVAVASGTQLVAYRIAYTFVTTGTNPGDNALQGKTVTAGFTWELQ